MSCLVKAHSQFELTTEKLDRLLDQIRERLIGRVLEAYIFGSASTGTINRDSDIDLILIVEKPSRPFVQRGFDFTDLFDIYPRLDILVYTPEEFRAQLANSEIGFWKSARLSLKRIA